MTEAQAGQLIRMVPEKDGHMLDIQWAVPSEIRAYRHGPCGYLSHLLGCNDTFWLIP